MLCGPIAWPEPIEQEEHPHERDQHQLGEHDLGYHGRAPSSSDEMRAFYVVFGLMELSAGWRYTTLHVLIVMIAGWMQRHQQQVITYLIEENRVLKAHLGGRRLHLTDTERRRLAALAYSLGRQRLKEIATLATPDTLLRWYQRLIAQKFDGSQHRRQLGRPRVAKEVEQLVVRMAEENPSWGYRRIQGALANLGHTIDKLTVRNILRRHHMEPAPQRRKAGMSWTQFLTLHWEVLAATDFFTVAVAAWHGLVMYYVRVMIELATRRVQIAGITPHP